MNSVVCPVCQGKWGGSCEKITVGHSFDGRSFECQVCGAFRATGSALEDSNQLQSHKLNDKKRAALSHFLRINQSSTEKPPLIDPDWLKKFIEDAQLPTPAQQATNIIRYIGDLIEASGRPLKTFPDSFFAAVGSPNPEFAHSISKELLEAGMLSGILKESMGNRGNMLNIGLTLAGWEKYELERRGKIAGSYGFIAMKFGDPVLDPFVTCVVKPAIIDIGYTLIDLREVARAGIIDNILREKIRDSAFVLVDLTHDNSGAYWEAGFAEGLGKPVLYLCEQAKFNEKKTHFDTNHCTTVTWRWMRPSHDFSRSMGGYPARRCALARPHQQPTQ